LDNKSSEYQEKSVEEGSIGNIDSKSFGPKPSKFQTSPNKKRNKVIIVDEEEEKEFGIHTSINNHISLGSVVQNDNRMASYMVGFADSGSNNQLISYLNGGSPDRMQQHLFN
jgi:hypothetical protein